MSRFMLPVVIILGLGALSAAACGQQVVQQPAFRQFAAPSTVLVPDRGATGLGGVGSSASARGTFGPVPLGASRAGGTGAARVQVRAWVHDFQAMDEALLGTEQPGRAVSGRPTSRSGSPPRQRAAR